ncbi:MAG: CYTH domain-containing protein [Bacteroidetes bacterium]|nr:CYTH domain-containing protein [Bacteroidota bacterium]
MPQEIERKYLVAGDEWRKNLSEADSSFIQQAYLSVDPDRVVRIRIRDNMAFLTIKSRTIRYTRSEFEYPIPHQDAIEMLKLCKSAVLIKRRYEIHFKGMLWEVDEFLGKNKGLILAEIELDHEDQDFVNPDWLGEEGTHDSDYTNLQLSMNEED